jgi:hypothetical protein
MAEKGSISRRQFVTAAISAAAVSSLPAHPVLAEIGARGKAIPQTAASLTDAPGWREQGVENLVKSPHAKLRDVPVRARQATSMQVWNLLLQA